MLQTIVQELQDYHNSVSSSYILNDYWKNESDYLARTISDMRLRGTKQYVTDRKQVHRGLRPIHFQYIDGYLILQWMDFDDSLIFQPTQLVHYQHYHEYYKSLGNYQTSLRDFIKNCFDWGLFESKKQQPELQGLYFDKPSIVYEFTFPEKLRRDFDNYVMKHITDQLVLKRFIPDDSIFVLDVSYRYKIEKGRSAITVWLSNSG